MIEQIFGSKTRVQLITLFIRNPDKGFFVREISRITGQYINSIRRELDNLERFGMLKTETKDKKKFFCLDSSFFLLDELAALFFKGKVFLENDLSNALKSCGPIVLLVFTGRLTGVNTGTDLLIVGDKIDVQKMKSILENFSLTIGHEIRYTLFAIAEFRYREEIGDSFLTSIFKDKKIVFIDKLK
jgi:hypothetical protein